MLYLVERLTKCMSAFECSDVNTHLTIPAAMSVAKLTLKFQGKLLSCKDKS